MRKLLLAATVLLLSAFSANKPFAAVVDAAPESLPKCTTAAPEHERSLLWNDANLGIDWGTQDPLLSEKDAVAPSFAAFQSPFL